MRCAIVGFGNVVQTDHAPAYKELGIEVASVIDISPSRLRVAQSVFPGCRVYASLDEALRQEKVDFCDIAVPPYLHAATAQKCVRKGIPVICEKPLLLRQAELLALLRDLKEYNTVLFPCHTWQYAPQLNNAIAMVASGAIGDPQELELAILRTSPALGIREWYPNWRTDPVVAGGGILMDHGYHALYLAQGLLQSRPSRLCVLRSTRDPVHNLDFEIEVEIEFLAPGMSNSPRRSTRAMLTWLASARSTLYRVAGATGTIQVQDSRTTLITTDYTELIAKDGGLTSSSQHPNWYNRLFHHFLDCSSQHQVFHAELLTACFTMESIWACYRSLSDGRPQDIESDAWLSFFQGYATQ